ncbi:GNAT family N-acetyltransferase [Mucilaginibacter psychrotolerans]|uniref:N-acetyltransferase n=1 Tax=Mucilaginibacter psychrotolerans TaxID=1524096 RepID=A0A4Y8S5T6_9SPHI|nr:GNAT family N-acetyltransferase [Mucilaginibacter psychrotolerans]TFF33900.1 N-acetyltransferase [Mucilaginibacter psychrotolerans]
MKIFELESTKLENELVALQLLQERDFERLYEVASDPMIWELHPVKDRYKKEVFRLYFNDAVASQSAFLVIDKATSDIIGCTRLYNYLPAQSSVAIGYTFLARNYWGGAYNSAMKSLLMEHLFKTVDNVLFHIAATNIRSQKATCKLGAVKVNEVDFDHYGTKLLHYEYLVKKSDYYK